MRSRSQTTDNLLHCYRRLELLIGDLAPDEWTVQSLCPDWDVRGVVTHLAGVEALLGDWLPTEEDNVPPFGRLGPNVERLDALSIEELIAEVSAILDRRRANLAVATDADYAHDSMTPVGPGTYHRFMNIRVFDFWVHQRDMTTPLGRATDDGGDAAETSVDEVEASIGYIVGKKIGLPDGMSIAFHLTGPVERDILARVDGRAAQVSELADPTVAVTTDSTTFVQLACGRIDPQGPIDDGRITWTGDGEWGDRAARNLRFTM
ncbi:MAG: maleylpyruvate isomerase family mycothiol-dependent enzyme [Actinomycetota bacterium]